MRLKLSIILFFILVFTVLSSAQCGPTVPSFTIDLTGAPNGVWQSPNVVRKGSCCGQNGVTCISFLITIDSLSAGIMFDIFSGAVPGGALFYQVDCGPETPLGTPICLSGVGPHLITFCKPGGNANVYQITAFKRTNAGTNITVNDGCIGYINAVGYLAPTVVWNSIYPGAIGEYNSYLSCTLGCLNPTVIGTGTMPPYVDYQICGSPNPICSFPNVCDTIRITFNPTLFVNIVPENPTICFGQSSTTLTAVGSGGTPPYTYLWNSVNPSQSIIVGNGIYTVQLNDATDCPPVYSTVTVTSYSVAISADAGPDQTICNQIPITTLNGAITGASGGIWSGGAGTFGPDNTTLSGVTYAPTAAELTAGFVNLILTSTGNGSCPAAADTVKINYVGFTGIVTFSTIPVSCFGGNNGSATATIPGGTPPYTYFWNMVPAQFTATATNLAMGTYTVTITNGTGCTAISSVTITEPLPLALASEITDVTCPGGNDGSVSIIPTGGISPYTYLWSNGATTAQISTLTAQIYTVTVTDFNACQIISPYTVTQPSPILIPIVPTHVSCFNGSDGIANSTVSGGTSPYAYNWSSGATSPVASGLQAGTFTLTITDNSGCLSSNTITLTQPAALVATTTSTNETCNYLNNGTATTVSSGGTPGYTYLWQPGALTTSSINNLSNGTYTLTTTDSNACTAITFAIITEPALLTINFINQLNVSCFTGNNGAVTVSPVGGTPNYTYLWAPGGAITATRTNLTAGTYTVTVTDAQGCIATNSIVITEPTLLSTGTTSTDETCSYSNNGTATALPAGGSGSYTYLWQPGLETSATVSNLSAGTYTLTVTDLNGCIATANPVITEPLLLSINFTAQTNVSCFAGSDGTVTASVSGGTAGYTYLWSNGATTPQISNLTAQTYTATVTDSQGCVTTNSVVITQPTLLTASTSTTNETCNYLNNGTATAIPTGGTAGYTYFWQPGAITSPAISNLAAGTYSLAITDAKGCIANTTALITQPLALTISFTQTNVSCFAGNDGTVSASPSGGTPNYIYSWAPGGATTASLSNLIAGTYTVTVTDLEGCVATNTVVISEPSITAASTTTTDETCNYLNNGTATAVPAGGTPGYTYLWQPGLQTSGTISNLSSGTYTLTVTDSKGCTAVTNAVIAEPLLLAITFTTQTNVSCFAGSDGTVTASPSGGTAGYTYLWNTGATTPQISNLTAQTYTATVTDSQGCVTTNSVVITQPTLLTASTSKTNETCDYLNNGTATALPTGGTAGYTYLWSSGETTALISNLASQTYSVTISDAKGCTANATAIITEPAPLAISFTQTNVSCFAGNDGTVSASSSGGTPNYTYSWAPGGATTASLSNLTAGTYTVTVTDLEGCVATNSVVILEPSITAASTTTTDETCNYLNNGTATAVPAGGTPGYTYLWQPGLQTSGTISNLSSGTYTLTVTDSKGCTAVTNAVIAEPLLLEITFTAQTNVSCFAGSDGTVTASPSGGTAGYIYLWNTGATTPQISNLTAQTYTATVTDSQGCVTTNSVVITQPAILTASTSKTNETCDYLNNGTATALPTGGTAGYTYLWSTGETTALISNLAAQTYSVTITDAKGCTANATAIITEPAPLAISFNPTHVSCFAGNDGTVSASPSGGTPNYTYSWAPGGAITNSIFNLSAGTYTVTVTDLEGCVATNSVVILEPSITAASTTTTDETCNYLNNGTATAVPAGGTPGYTYLWQPGLQTSGTISNLSSGTYTLTVTDSKGCTAVTNAVIAEPLLLAITFTAQTNVSCFAGSDGTVTASPSGGTAGYTYLWNTGATTPQISNLTAQTYTATVTDSQGCVTTNSVVITQPTLLTASTSKTNETCDYLNNGTATALPTGGTAGYTYLWSTGETTALISNLAAQTYTVTITDAKGCTANATAIITEPAPLAISFSPTPVSCFAGNDGAISASPSGGSPNYTYSWAPGGAITNSIFNLSAGTYSLTITDNKGCQLQNSVIITQPLAPLSISASSLPAACFGEASGSVSSSAADGTGPYTYTWMPGSLTGQNISNLAAGTYTVTAQDSKGCLATNSITVTQSAQIVLTTSSVNSDCGQPTGQSSVTVSGGNTPYSYLWTPTGGTDATADSLVSGAYHVTVTDFTGCTSEQFGNVNENTAPVATIFSVTNVNCFGGATGSAQVGTSGGEAPFTYIWSPSGGTDSIATGLTAGTYTVTVTGNNNCQSLATTSPDIIQPAEILITVTTSPVSCFDGNDGTASAIASGGTPGYTYEWLPSETMGPGITGLRANTYSIEVIDTNGCIKTAPFTIVEPLSAISASLSFTPVSCFEGSDGTVSASAAGGTGPYNYTWMPGNFNGQNISNLTTGTYTVTISDSKGCTFTDDITVTQPTLIVLTTDSINSNCSLANGQASVSASGGTGAYLYQWAPSGGTNANATALFSGAYTVEVTDGNGCISLAGVTVNDNASPVATVTATTNVSCNTGADGTATVSVAGGAGPFTYSWLPAGGTNPTATGLVPGTYTVTVTDINLCESNPAVSAEITQPSPILITVTKSMVSCFGGSDGTASAIASGGTPGYTYQWLPGGTAGTNISNLAANTYTVEATDTNSCVQIQAFTITQPPAALSVSMFTTPVSCFAGANGTVSASAAGGTAPYNYSWMPGNSNGPGFSNLTTGTYTVTITDIKGCSIMDSIAVIQPTLIVLTTDSINSNCSLANGQASVSAAGGTGAYLYQWAPSGGTNANATALFSGAYTVEVTDGNGCISLAGVTVNDNASPVATVTATTNVSCNTGADGTATVSVAGGAGPFTYSWLPAGGTNPTATGLVPGTYTVTVTDINLCESNPAVSAEITQPSPILITVTKSMVSCFGGSDGTASAIASGGTPGYTYQWLPGGTAGTNISNLAANTYTVEATDTNSCVQIQAFTITQPPAALSVSMFTTPVSCFAGANGTVSASAAGGTAPYNYSWMPGNSNGPGFSNLTTGTYTVTITDIKGCSIIDSITVTQPTLIVLTTDSINSNCSLANGQASVSASGGTGAYLYQWAPSGGTNANATALFSGAYTVEVTDGNGCISLAGVTVNDNASPVATVTATTNVSCNTGADGTATVSVAGGAGPFTYSWLPAGGTNPTATGLVPGTYTVTVTDINLCQSNPAVSAEITQPSPILITVTKSMVSCFGASDGTASAIASGGTPGYTYQWLPGGTAGTSISNLAANTYTVEATDTNSCVQTQAFTITQPPAALSLSMFTTPVSCFAGANGTVSASAAGGTAPYNYSWMPGNSNGPGFSNLTTGTYTVTVTDIKGCSIIDSITVTQPTLIVLTTDSINSNCSLANGQASVSASGGTGAYLYQWAPSGGTNANATALFSGAYTVEVTDGNGCTSLTGVTVNDNASPVATVTATTNVSCNTGADGTATVSVAGGAGPFTYSWLPAGGTNPTATGLVPGTYTVTVTDINLCQSNPAVSAEITQPSPILISVTKSPVSCFGGSDGTASAIASGGTPGYTYQWLPSGTTGTSISNLAANTYTVEATDTNSCVQAQAFTVTQPPAALSLSMFTTPVSCFAGANGTVSASAAGGTAPYNYSWMPGNSNGPGFSNLTTGTYTVTITDIKGCSIIDSITVTQPTLIVLTTDSINSNCSLANGQASVSASGGTGAYLYQWAPSGGTNANATALFSGAYTVEVTDGNGCTSLTGVTVNDNASPVATVTATTNVSCNTGADGTATVSVAGGAGPFTYSWLPAGGTNPTATGLVPGTYTVTVTDINLCQSNPAVSAEITQPSPILISVTKSPVSCFGGSDGTASAIASGGTPGYTYQWLPGGTAGISISNLAANTYTVEATDTNSCVQTQAFTITQPPVALSVSLSFTPVSCFGGTNGSVSSSAGGGTAPYNYNWMPGNSNGPNFFNLAIGTYTVTVTDAKGCTAMNSITVTQPSLIVLTTDSINSNCSMANGQASVSASGGAGFYMYQWSPAGGTNASATALIQGTYSVTVTDANGCISIAGVTVNDNASPVASVNTITNVSCTGGSDGTATVNVSGGIGPFTYSWVPSGGSNSTATGLVPGTYTVTVTDVNLCQSNPATSPEITQPYPILLTVTKTNVSCFGGNDGTASAIASGGSGGYTYQWLPIGSSGPGITNLSAGTYTVQVTDINNCVQTIPFIITEPGQLTSVISASGNVSCFGGNNGFATAAANGGIPAYNYSWLPFGGNGPTGSGLTAGTYTIRVTDFNGCIDSSSVTITQPFQALSATTTGSATSCSGGSNGTASINTNGGTPAYTYQWTPAVSSNDTAFGLSAGNYTILVTDSNSCQINVAVSISGPSAISGTLAIVNPSCGLSNGSITSQISGGTMPYSYLWTGSTSTNSGINNTGPGAYNLLITDSLNCTLSLSANLINIQSPSITISSVNNVSCYGRNDGSATITISQGTPPYIINWTPSGGNNLTASFLSVGTYKVKVIDAIGCLASDSVDITEPSPVDVTIASLKNVLCFGGNTGSITVSTSGGTGPLYSYSWSPSSSSSSTAATLTAGTYTVNVTDQNNCVKSISAPITEPLELSTSINSVINPSCFEGTGSASVLVTGGTFPYMYSWSAPAVGQTGSNADGLIAGSYTVSVTDTNGCVTSNNVLITQPSQIITIAGANDTLCLGQSGSVSATATGGGGNYSYGWQPSGSITSGTLPITPISFTTYTVVAYDQSGCPGKPASVSAIVYTLSGANVQAYASSPICPGQNSLIYVETSGTTGPLTYQWNNNLGTGPGVYYDAPTQPTTYIVTVYNVCGLYVSDSVDVVFSPQPTIGLTSDLTNLCANEGVQFNDASVTGNINDPITSWFWNFGDGFSSIDQNPYHNFGQSGTFYVTLTVNTEGGCTSTNDSIPLTITSYPAPVAAFSLNSSDLLIPYDILICTNQSAGANSYDWSFGEGGISSEVNPQYVYTLSGVFQVQLIATSQYGCLDTAVAEVTTNTNVIFPNVFTPNPNGPSGGGYTLFDLSNDVFFPYTYGVIEYKLEIFNRWGEEIFESLDIKQGWDGYYRGQLCQQDVYVWRAYIKLNNGKIYHLSGDITLLE